MVRAVPSWSGQTMETAIFSYTYRESMRPEAWLGAQMESGYQLPLSISLHRLWLKTVSAAQSSCGRKAPPQGLKVRAQRLDAFGSGQWPAGGINVCDLPTDQGRASAHSDGNGGAVVTWLDSRTPWVLVSQRVTSDGERLWADGGVVLGPGIIPGSYGPNVISNGNGGTIVVREVGTETQSSLFVHGIGADGGVPTAIAPLTPPNLVVSESFPNPFASVTRIDIALGRAGPVFADVFDVAGRRVRAMPAQQFASGAQSIVFDGRGDDGRRLPSGVYFLRIEVNGESITRKMVIAR